MKEEVSRTFFLEELQVFSASFTLSFRVRFEKSSTKGFNGLVNLPENNSTTAELRLGPRE
jgi:hypothetical protein